MICLFIEVVYCSVDEVIREQYWNSRIQRIEEVSNKYYFAMVMLIIYTTTIISTEGHPRTIGNPKTSIGFYLDIELLIFVKKCELYLATQSL
jgi:hypothetical protein